MTGKKGDNVVPVQGCMVGLICEVFEAIVARSLAIAVCDNNACLAHNLDPPLINFLNQSRSAGSFVVKNDFVSTANRSAKANGNFIEVDLKHTAKSAMQCVPKGLP